MCLSAFPRSVIAALYSAPYSGRKCNTMQAGRIGLHGGRLRVVSAAGLSVADENISAGTTRLRLPAGIYLLQWDDEAARKIFIP